MFARRRLQYTRQVNVFPSAQREDQRNHVGNGLSAKLVVLEFYNSLVKVSHM